MTEPYRISPVSDRTTLSEFIRVPWPIYRDDPNWVPPLEMERRETLSPKNPFFEHAEWQGWIAYEDDRPVGRISAQIDRLYLERYGSNTGFFGLIEARDDVRLFGMLTETAESWLRDKGMDRILGPFNLGINQEVGVLVDGFDTPPYFLMGHARPYYDHRLQEVGYRGCQDMLAYLTRPDFELPKLFARQLRSLRKELSIRPLDRGRKAVELETVRELFNDAWSENWGFVPFTKAEFAKIGSELMHVVPGDMTLIAERDGRAEGFIVMVPNLNELIRDLNGRLLPFGWLKLLWRLKVGFPQTARVPLMGVRKALHHTPLGPGIAISLIETVRKNAQRRGVNMVETSWILEDNAGMRKIMEHIGGHISKRYRMYEKVLA
jgi:hypothetical protein